jgi:hypothetical protein
MVGGIFGIETVVSHAQQSIKINLKILLFYGLSGMRKAIRPMKINITKFSYHVS